MANFQYIIIFLLAIVSLSANDVEAKALDTLELATKLQKKKQQSVNPKLAASEMLKTIEQLYINRKCN